MLSVSIVNAQFLTIIKFELKKIGWEIKVCQTLNGIGPFWNRIDFVLHRSAMNFQLAKNHYCKITSKKWSERCDLGTSQKGWTKGVSFINSLIVR